MTPPKHRPRPPLSLPALALLTVSLLILPLFHSLSLRALQLSNAFTTPLLPNELAPRQTLHVTSAITPSSQIHAIILLPTKASCAPSSHTRALTALLHQSRLPAHISLLHSCHRAFAPAHQSPLVNSTLCEKEFDQCVFDLLNRANSEFLLLIAERDVLEPTAVEKLWLYMKLRPKVSSMRTLSYNEASLHHASSAGDPLLLRRNLPSAAEPFDPLPVLCRMSAFKTADRPNDNPWHPFLEVLKNGRLLRDPLFTRVQSREYSDFHNASRPMTIPLEKLGPAYVPPRLKSNLAFYRWSAREEVDIYEDNGMVSDTVDLSPLPFQLVTQKDHPRLFFVMPWLQMGGSEKAMLDLADHVANSKWDGGWQITFVLTMPFWSEDQVGEVSLRHAWMDRALAITSDVFDIVALSTNAQSSRAFRYLLESRRPDYLLLSNSRWAYAHSEFIRAISPATILVDYNHMIHPTWMGGGLPRFGANNSEFFDLHLTASEDVAKSMRMWIQDDIMKLYPEKARPCHIGTDPDVLFKGTEKGEVRDRMRQSFNISADATVVLFAGRFVVDKGIDVLTETVKKVVQDPWLLERLVFIFVGDGVRKDILVELQSSVMRGRKGGNVVLLQPPVAGLLQLREYYAMSDIFLLPSVNEGIALVLYEAMAAGMLVMATDVGGQREIITPETGVLMPNSRNLTTMTLQVVAELREALQNPEKVARIANNGLDLVRSNYTTYKFCRCIVDNLAIKKNLIERDGRKGASQPDLESVQRKLTMNRKMEGHSGMWGRNSVNRGLEHMMTIGIKTYVCDSATVSQVRSLVRSIRAVHERVRVLLGNDGPLLLGNESFVQDDPFTEEIVLPSDSGISAGRNALVKATGTEYFVLLDDDHVLEDTTDLNGLLAGIRVDRFDIVGMRVRNLPGIDELERLGISVPRYVSVVRKFENRQLTLCVWNENNGPSVFGMEHPIPVDVVHNAFIARTDVLRRHPWREELHVNEHMTFFLDARKAELKVGYLPSVFVHHRAREYSKCYFSIRFREDKFRALLDYDDRFEWDLECGKRFPDRVRSHILSREIR